MWWMGQGDGYQEGNCRNEEGEPRKDIKLCDVDENEFASPSSFHSQPEPDMIPLIGCWGIESFGCHIMCVFEDFITA